MSATITDCRHDMPVNQCAYCNGAIARAEAHARPDVGLLPRGLLQAKYPGQCAGCGESFDTGDVIRRSDADSGWVGTECCT